MQKSTSDTPTTPGRPFINQTKVAWVTGASSGIGAALAVALAKAGWQVAISARRGEALAALAGQQAGLHAFPLDVTDAAATTSIINQIERKLGPITLAVLNAGGYRRDSALTLTNAHMAEFLQLNVMGMVHGFTALMPRLAGRAGAQIAIVSSVAGYRGLPSSLAYCASKAALIAFAEAAQPECLAAGIKLQIINPGFVKTPLTDKNDFAMPFLVPVEKAAAAIIKGLASNHFEIAFPLPFVLLMKLLRVLPDPLFFWLSGAAHRERERAMRQASSDATKTQK